MDKYKKQKIIAFYRYFKDFLSNREFASILTALNYSFFNQTPKKDKVIKSKIGLVYTRKGTIDFKSANFAYEWGVKKFILKNYKDYNIFLDIGTNIGIYSLFLAKQGLKCYAFEPVKYNYEILLKNIEINNLKNKIEALNYGLGKFKKKEEFIIDPVNTGASHIACPDETGIRTKVDIYTLDSVISKLNLNKNDKILIKVDVEGMEKQVFEGAQYFLKTFTDFLLIFETVHSDIKEIKDLLNKNAKLNYLPVDYLNIAAKKQESCLL